MGNKSLSTEASSQILNKYWQKITPILYRNKATQQIIKQKRLIFSQQQQMRYVFANLVKRMNNYHPNVIKLVYLRKLIQPTSICQCGPKNVILVYVENVQFTLERWLKIRVEMGNRVSNGVNDRVMNGVDAQNKQQHNCLCLQLLKAAMHLKQRYGPFILKPTNIWIQPHKNSHQPLQSTQPQYAKPQYLSGTKIKLWISSQQQQTFPDQSCQQKEMVLSILDLIRHVLVPYKLCKCYTRLQQLDKYICCSGLKEFADGVVNDHLLKSDNNRVYLEKSSSVIKQTTPQPIPTNINKQSHHHQIVTNHQIPFQRTIRSYSAQQPSTPTVNFIHYTHPINYRGHEITQHYPPQRKYSSIEITRKVSQKQQLNITVGGKRAQPKASSLIMTTGENLLGRQTNQKPMAVINPPSIKAQLCNPPIMKEDLQSKIDAKLGDIKPGQKKDTINPRAQTFGSKIRNRHVNNIANRLIACSTIAADERGSMEVENVQKVGSTVGENGQKNVKEKHIQKNVLVNNYPIQTTIQTINNNDLSNQMHLQIHPKQPLSTRQRLQTDRQYYYNQKSSQQQRNLNVDQSDEKNIVYGIKKQYLSISLQKGLTDRTKVQLSKADSQKENQTIVNSFQNISGNVMEPQMVNGVEVISSLNLGVNVNEEEIVDQEEGKQARLRQSLSYKESPCSCKSEKSNSMMHQVAQTSFTRREYKFEQSKHLSDSIMESSNNSTPEQLIPTLPMPTQQSLSRKQQQPSIIKQQILSLLNNQSQPSPLNHQQPHPSKPSQKRSLPIVYSLQNILIPMGDIMLGRLRHTEYIQSGQTSKQMTQRHSTEMRENQFTSLAMMEHKFMTVADIAAEHIETEEKMIQEECVMEGLECVVEGRMGCVVTGKESDHPMQESGYFLGMSSKKPSQLQSHNSKLSHNEQQPNHSHNHTTNLHLHIRSRQQSHHSSQQQQPYNPSAQQSMINIDTSSNSSLTMRQPQFPLSSSQRPQVLGLQGQQYPEYHVEVHRLKQRQPLSSSYTCSREMSQQQYPQRLESQERQPSQQRSQLQQQSRQRSRSQLQQQSRQQSRQISQQRQFYQIHDQRMLMSHPTLGFGDFNMVKKMSLRQEFSQLLDFPVMDDIPDEPRNSKRSRNLKLSQTNSKLTYRDNQSQNDDEKLFKRHSNIELHPPMHRTQLSHIKHSKWRKPVSKEELEKQKIRTDGKNMTEEKRQQPAPQPQLRMTSSGHQDLSIKQKVKSKEAEFAQLKHSINTLLF